MKVDELVRNLRHVEQGYAEKHYSVGEVRVCDMAKDCADALEALTAGNEREKNGNEVLRAERDELHRNNCKLRDTNKALESDNYNLNMNLEHITAALAPFRTAAADYGIDAQTMLTLAKSQITTAKENCELRDENEKLQSELIDYHHLQKVVDGQMKQNQRLRRIIEKLTARAEKAEQERSAAIKDINSMLNNVDSVICCHYCAKSKHGEYCGFDSEGENGELLHCFGEWRGTQEEE